MMSPCNPHLPSKLLWLQYNVCSAVSFFVLMRQHKKNFMLHNVIGICVIPRYSLIEPMLAPSLCCRCLRRTSFCSRESRIMRDERSEMNVWNNIIIYIQWTCVTVAKVYLSGVGDCSRSHSQSIVLPFALALASHSIHFSIFLLTCK